MDAPSRRLLLGSCKCCVLTEAQDHRPFCLLTQCFNSIGQIQMVELLVANGADLDSKSVLDETPLGESGGGGRFSPPLNCICFLRRSSCCFRYFRCLKTRRRSHQTCASTKRSEPNSWT